MFIKRTINKIIFHHTADITVGSQYEKTNEYHKNIKKFPLSGYDSYVGYHILIEQSGDIIFCRPLYEIGAHDAGENMDSVGIALAGNFDIAVPTEMQEIAFAKACDMVFTVVEKQLPIEPHRKGDSTDCPGKKLTDNWGTRIYLKYKISWLQKLVIFLQTLTQKQ